MRTRTLRVLALALLPLVALSLAGCDEAATDDAFTFVVDNVSFTFTFQGSAIDGDAIEVSAQSSENILDDFPSGFGADDVTRVGLVDGSAQIRLLNPVGVTIGVLDDVSLRLSAGSSSVEVASAENIETGGSMTGEASLETTTANIAGVVTGGDFDATLDVSGDPGLPDETYRVEVFFDVEVTVPAF
ncbi:MAG: hypothetical protein R3181_11405 [Rubricoccaceae bacterium]|nr:hypothetical protein [Rubricoccaceae bacterium]